jgi:very-short-patch-repair endonuclease
LAVEIDDPSHHRRYAADASRDQLIRDAGVETYRIVLEDVLDERRLDEHADRILSRLGCFR